MAYIDREKVCEMCNNKGVDCGKEKCPVYKVPTADVVPKSEVERLELTLQGVMWSVDKWLDGEELKQDEVNRAITMREKTLRIIEDAKSEIERLEKDNKKLTINMNAFGLTAIRQKEEKDALAREIFEEIEGLITNQCLMLKDERGVEGYVKASVHYALAELKKKYTKGEHDEQI